MLGYQTQLHRHLLDGIDRGSVDIGLTGFTQPAIAHVNTEPLQQAFKRSRAAIQRGGLNDFRDEQSAAG